MKKLAIALLLVVSSCRRQGAGGESMGAPSARAAVDQFMAAAKAKDLDAMGRIWGTSQGPTISTMPATERERREVSIMPCLKHDRFVVLNDTPATGGKRQFSVELRYKEVVAAAPFVAVMGPGGRWYVESVEVNDLRQICVAR